MKYFIISCLCFLILTIPAQCQDLDVDDDDSDAGDLADEVFPLTEEDDLRGNTTLSDDDDFEDEIDFKDENGIGNGTLSHDDGGDSPDIETYAHRRGQTRRPGTRKKSHGRKKGSRMSRVNMPTGKSYFISRPSTSNWKCGRPTKLIRLDPKGKKGKREYNIVKTVVERTKRNHQNGKFKKYNIVKIEKVVNGCFWRRFRKNQNFIKRDAGFVNERMLFHGSNKVKELLETGFDESYSKLDGMFGAGIYFAKHSSKSNLYAFGLNGPCPAHKDRNCAICERKIILCRVTMGKIKKEKEAHRYAHPPPRYNSVEGVPSKGKLRFPEYIVYRGEQVYPEFVITYKIVK